MPKNGLNDLKFGHNKNYDDFNRFQKNWQNLAKNVDFLAENQHFFFCGFNFSLAVFIKKFMRFQENGPICLIFGIYVPWSTYHNNWPRFF